MSKRSPNTQKPFICTNPICRQQFSKPTWWEAHATESKIGCINFSVKSLHSHKDNLYHANYPHVVVNSSHPELVPENHETTFVNQLPNPPIHEPQQPSCSTVEATSSNFTLPLASTETVDSPSEDQIYEAPETTDLSDAYTIHGNSFQPGSPISNTSDLPAFAPSTSHSEPSSPPSEAIPSEENYRTTYIRKKAPDGVVYTHPTAGQVYGKEKTRWERAYDENQLKRNGNRWGIFGSERQWQIAFWMATTKTSQRSLDDLLQTHIMSGLSFKRAKKLFRIVENKMALHGGAVWNEIDIRLDDAPDDSHTLWYRDIQAALDDLFGRATLSGKMAYAPVVLHEADDKTRRYDNPWTGKLWNRLQGKVPVGTTIGGVMIASDSTQLSTHSGNVSAHAVYMSLANIDKSIRNQTSQNLWVLVAYIPVSRFTNTMLKYEDKPKSTRTRIVGLLNRRLLHKSLSVVTRPLRRLAPHLVTDPDGNRRLVVYKMIAYIADYEEQTRLAGIGSKSCPHCLATALNLGNAEEQPTRTSNTILDTITQANSQLANKYPDGRFWALDFLDEATNSKLGLNGVDKPFWRSIPDFDICEILSPDLLHGFHKFFYDHVFNWNSLSLGTTEMDARMRSQIRLTGDRSFAAGVSHLSQTTMKEHRDLQRVHVSVVAGAPIDDARKLTEATRAIMDCIYLAQLSSHSDFTLDAYRSSHQEFHARKAIWIDNGSRLGKENKKSSTSSKQKEVNDQESRKNHFHIPKLHILRHLAEQVELKGTADNYTTEAMEHLHIDLVKNAYRASNRRNWKEQITRWLTRREKIRDFDAWLKWCEEYRAKHGESCGSDNEAVLERDWADEDDDNEPDAEDNELAGLNTNEVDQDGLVGSDEVYGEDTGDQARETEFVEWLLGEAEITDLVDRGATNTEVGQNTSETIANHPAESSRGPTVPQPNRKRARGENKAGASKRARLQQQPTTPQGLTHLQSIRAKPLVRRVPIHQVIDKYGVLDLLAELVNTPYARSLPNPPDQFTCVDLWPYIHVQPPARPHTRETGLQRVRIQRMGTDHSGPNTEPSDPVLYLNSPGYPSSATRISGEYLYI